MNLLVVPHKHLGPWCLLRVFTTCLEMDRLGKGVECCEAELAFTLRLLSDLLPQIVIGASVNLLRHFADQVQQLKECAFELLALAGFTLKSVLLSLLSICLLRSLECLVLQHSCPASEGTHSRCKQGVGSSVCIS